MKVFGVVGWKNTGKTTLVANLVHYFTGEGLRVATIKHAHKGFNLDHPGTDSSTHRDAGAIQTALLAEGRWALMNEVATDTSLTAMLARLDPCDLVLVEGFKAATHSMIECVSGDRRSIFVDNEAVVAVASDEPVDTTLPVFKRDDVATIAALIRKVADA
jgi:molybdopterin-guanine dinucleotide biosynthesis protein B